MENIAVFMIRIHDVVLGSIFGHYRYFHFARYIFAYFEKDEKTSA